MGGHSKTDTAMLSWGSVSNFSTSTGGFLMRLRSFLPFFTGLIIILLLFYVVREEWGQKNCLLEKSEVRIECSAIHVMFADEGVVDIVEYKSDGTAVHFAEMYLKGEAMNGRPPGGGSPIFTEENNWTEELGIKPPCVLQGKSGIVELEKEGYILRWPVMNHVDCNGPREVTPQEITGFQVPQGRVYFAYYVIPTRRVEFRIYRSISWGGPVEFEDVRVGCTCQMEKVVGELEKAIKVKGFEEVILEKRPTENEYFKPLSVKLYRRGDQYLYVEFSEVKGMDLVRVLMIMGDEKIVKAYAKAFTAGVIGE